VSRITVLLKEASPKMLGSAINNFPLVGSVIGITFILIKLNKLMPYTQLLFISQGFWVKKKLQHVLYVKIVD